jgi:nucleoside-diphosphate-sugar epimerase
MMKITVTGATGFAGSHVAVALQDDGHAVSLLARDPSKLIAPLQKCRAIKGDLLEPATIREAVAGADAVVHCAAYVGEWGSRDDYFRTNVAGTQNMIDACVAAGVRRFLHFSSNSVYGDGAGDHIAVAEETPFLKTGLYYCDSKIDAETRVFAAHEAGQIVATAIRPGMIWGPRDRQFLPKIIDAIEHGVMMYPGTGRKLVGLTHVENIVAVIRLCLANDVSRGRVYNVDDDDRRTLRDLVGALCARLGRKPPKIAVPASLAKALATASEFVWKAAGAKTPPLLTKLGVYTLVYDNDVSVERAKNELGYDPRELFDERLDAYLASYRAGE